MSTIALINSLKDKEYERLLLLDTLRMWGEVKSQGIEPDSVQGFTFIEAYCNAQQKERIYRLRCYNEKPKPLYENGKLVLYNAVRLNNGELKELKPWIKGPKV